MRPNVYQKPRVSHSQGVYHWDQHGNQYLDASSGAMVDWLNGDWGIFFVITAVMVIPSLIFLWFIRNKLKLQ